MAKDFMTVMPIDITGQEYCAVSGRDTGPVLSTMPAPALCLLALLLPPLLLLLLLLASNTTEKVCSVCTVTYLRHAVDTTADRRAARCGHRSAADFEKRFGAAPGVGAAHHPHVRARAASM